MLNAIMIMVVALALPILRFTEAGAGRIAVLLVGTGWANTLFYWAALLAPNRALSFGDNRSGEANWVARLGLAPALVFTVLIFIAFALIACQALARR